MFADQEAMVMTDWKPKATRVACSGVYSPANSSDSAKFATVNCRFLIASRVLKKKGSLRYSARSIPVEGRGSIPLDAASRAPRSASKVRYA